MVGVVGDRFPSGSSGLMDPRMVVVVGEGFPSASSGLMDSRVVVSSLLSEEMCVLSAVKFVVGDGSMS